MARVTHPFNSLTPETEGLPSAAQRRLLDSRRLLEAKLPQPGKSWEIDAWAYATHSLQHGNNFDYSRAFAAAGGAAISPSLPSNDFRDNSSASAFAFIDLFAGIGGFHLALARAGGQCVFASEWDASARCTYAFNHGLVPFGDIRAFTRHQGSAQGDKEVSKLIPSADVISAGFPCQPFSQAGVSSRNFHGIHHGLKCDVQGTLFEDILIIARAIKPKVLLLENVSNLARHDGGNTIRTIFEEIESSGYVIYPKKPSGSDTRWAVIDSASVVGQRRRRVYFVCVRADLVKSHGDFVFPDFSLPEVPHSLRSVIERDTSMTEIEKLERYSISRKLWESHLSRQARHVAKSNGFRIGLMNNLDNPAPTLVARYYKDGKDCLIPNRFDGSAPPRMLTPRECALLQTYPSDFWLPESKTPAYKQMGNSITVEIAARISEAIASQYLRGQ